MTMNWLLVRAAVTGKILLRYRASRGPRAVIMLHLFESCLNRSYIHYELRCRFPRESYWIYSRDDVMNVE